MQDYWLRLSQQPSCVAVRGVDLGTDSSCPASALDAVEQASSSYLCASVFSLLGLEMIIAPGGGGVARMNESDGDCKIWNERNILLRLLGRLGGRRMW